MLECGLTAPGPLEPSCLTFFSHLRVWEGGRCPVVKTAPHASPLPALPGERGSARHEHARLLPATLPDLLPAPAGEAAAAAEGRQQAVP